MTVKSLSRVRLFTTPWTAAYQAPPSMGFSRQEYWSGVPSPSPFQVLLKAFQVLISGANFIEAFQVLISFSVIPVRILVD